MRKESTGYYSYIVFVSHSLSEFYFHLPFHSLGRTEGGPLEFERAAFQQFYEDGLLLVAAAGNHGTSQDSWPASYESVISVAGTHAYDCLSNVIRIQHCFRFSLHSIILQPLILTKT